MKKNTNAQPVSELDMVLGGTEKKKKKGAKEIINIIINIVLVVAIVIAAFCTYVAFTNKSGSGKVPSIFGVQMLSIKTDSMYPTLEPGDLIFDTEIKSVNDIDALKVDDVITYWTVIDGERVLNTHRIVNIYDGGEVTVDGQTRHTRIFRTKGDKNTAEDALTVNESEIVGKWEGKVIGGLGQVFDFLQTSTGFLVIVVIPVALFFIFHLVQFFRVLFEYQNVKNRLLYEQERGKNEDALDAEKEQLRQEEREKLEAELREKLKSEVKAETAVKTEAEIRAELEAKIRAEYEAKNNENKSGDQ